MKKQTYLFITAIALLILIRVILWGQDKNQEIEIYGANDLYYIKPYKLEFATESGRYAIKANSPKEFRDSIHDITLRDSEDLKTLTDWLFQHLSLKYYPDNKAIFWELTDPYTNKTYQGLFNTRDDFGEYYQYYITD